MKKLLLLAIALGSLAAACTQPAPPCILCTDVGHDGGAAGAGQAGGDNGGAAGAGQAGSAGAGQAGAGGTNVIPGNTARDIYLQKVHPSILDTCGQCHQASAQLGPGWMDTDPPTSYELSKAYNGLVMDPASDSIIITKPPHSGPALTDVQKGIVTEWLNKEIEEGKGGTGTTGTTSVTPSGPTTEQMLKEFGNCMNYDLWVSSGMANFPNQQTELGPCKSCHNQGLGGTYLNADPQMTFDHNRVMPFVLRMVLPEYMGATPTGLAPSLRFEQKGTETCTNPNPALCHPKYTLTPENLKAFESFVGDTLTKWQAGACPPLP